MTHPPGTVRIDYLRPPNRRDVFIQKLLLDTPQVKVTLAEDIPFDPPIRIQDQIALEAGSDAVWFTFPNCWHDIGHFHRADGTFTGTYANILTPPIFLPGGRWETTDLFLDVWIDLEGTLWILDRDQLLEAEEKGWISPGLAQRAREEVARIEREHKAGQWPPEVVLGWDLDRARQLSSRTTQAAERRPKSR